MGWQSFTFENDASVLFSILHLSFITKKPFKKYIFHLEKMLVKGLNAHFLFSECELY